VASICDSEACHCTIPIIHQEASFTLSTCCFHPSYTLAAFGGSESRLLSWQYQIYSQSWLANFARMARLSQNFCNVKLQAVEQIDAASFVSRDCDDRALFASRFESNAIAADGNFEVTVMHDLTANPERTLKISGQTLTASVLNRFEDNLISLQGLRGHLIFCLRDKIRPFKLRSWGALPIDDLLDQKSRTQWVHLQKYEDSLAPSKKEKIFSEGYSVLATVSVSFDRRSIDLPIAGLEPSAYIAPPQCFSHWLSAHSQSHVSGSCAKSQYIQFMFQILCRRMISCIAQLKVHGDYSVSWLRIAWNPELPFPREICGMLTCFAHTYGVAPIYFNLQFAQELLDAFMLSNYHNHSFIKKAVQCLSEALLLASGFSDTNFEWFQTLVLTAFQSSSRSLFNVLVRKQCNQLHLMVIVEDFVNIFTKLNSMKIGMHIIEHALAKGIPPDTVSIGLSSGIGDFSKDQLMKMVLQDFVSLGDTTCLQSFSQSIVGMLSYPSVYVGQQFLDILNMFSKFLLQWKGVCQGKEMTKLIGCAVLGFYRKIICNAVDLSISSTLKGHDVLELWHCMHKVHSLLRDAFELAVPDATFVDFAKLLAPIWLETLPETANALALTVCEACRVDNMEICDPKKRISSSVIDGLQSSGIVVHEMQFVSQNCLAAASHQLRLRMMMGLIRIPIRAAQELQIWIQKTFCKILGSACNSLQTSKMTQEFQTLINHLCILCNNVAFLKDSIIFEAEQWTRYYENLVAGSVLSSKIPGFKADYVIAQDESCFGPGLVRIKVFTSSSIGSGTNSKVFIVLHGVSGSDSSGKQQLQSEYDAFGTGCVGTFTIHLAEALHHISKIEARKN
jgi:hypothetical protein